MTVFIFSELDLIIVVRRLFVNGIVVEVVETLVLEDGYCDVDEVVSKIVEEVKSFPVQDVHMLVFILSVGDENVDVV